jgi:hypothetical protein
MYASSCNEYFPLTKSTKPNESRRRIIKNSGPVCPHRNAITPILVIGARQLLYKWLVRLQLLQKCFVFEFEVETWLFDADVVDVDADVVDDELLSRQYSLFNCAASLYDIALLGLCILALNSIFICV